MRKPLLAALFAVGIAGIGWLVVFGLDGDQLERQAYVPGLSRQVDEAPAATQSYDFEGGAGPWELDPGIWSIGAAGGSQALIGNGHGFARIDGIGPISRLQFRFQLDDGSSAIHASLFETFEPSHTRYFAAIGPTGATLFRQEGATFKQLGEEPMQLPLGEMLNATISVGGGSLDLFIDGAAVVGADDPAPPPPGAVSFESLGGTVVVDDVAITLGIEQAPHVKAPRSPENYPLGPNVGPFVNGTHSGDITLTGNQTLTLSTGRYTVEAGGIKLHDDSRLLIKEGAALIFDRGNSPLIHWGIDLTGDAALELEGGSIAATDGLVRINAFGQSTVEIRNARPRIHFINAGGDATVSIANSRFVTPIGGSVQLNENVSVDISNSQIGAIAFFIRSGQGLTARGLEPGHIDDFDLHRDLQTSGIGYRLRLRNVDLVPDTLGEGPFERGWVIFADESANVDLSNSTLRKIVFEFPNSGPPLAVNGLRLDQPTDLSIGGVKLTNVAITGQWGFFLHADREAVFDDCDALWFFIFDTAKVLLKDSTMNEFDPRQYHGVFGFENGEWTTSGEIIEGNDFVMEGTYTTDADVRASLSWSTSQVRRRFPVEVEDGGGSPVAGVQVMASRSGVTRTATTDASGAAILELPFGDADFATPWSVSAAGGSVVQVDFFTATPLDLVTP